MINVQPAGSYNLSKVISFDSKNGKAYLPLSMRNNENIVVVLIKDGKEDEILEKEVLEENKQKFVLVPKEWVGSNVTFKD